MEAGIFPGGVKSLQFQATNDKQNERIRSQWLENKAAQWKDEVKGNFILKKWKQRKDLKKAFRAAVPRSSVELASFLRTWWCKYFAQNFATTLPGKGKQIKTTVRPSNKFLMDLQRASICGNSISKQEESEKSRQGNQFGYWRKETTIEPANGFNAKWLSIPDQANS